MARNEVLLVDDEAAIRFGIGEFLRAHGYAVSEAEDCQAAEEAFRRGSPDVVILDHQLPDGDAIGLMRRLKEIDPEVPLLMLTGHASIDLAVQAVKEGAEQFLTKPIALPTLLIMLQRLLENQRNRQQRVVGRNREAREEVDPFIGSSAAIRRLSEQAHKVIHTDSPVLIQGATGSGKGMLARWLHRNGPRADEACVDLNCAGLSREFLETEMFGHEKGAFTGAATSKLGLLELAQRGTVFLDEIGDMPAEVQPKLLKVLEEKRFRRMGDVRERSVDIRLISATHQDLAGSVASGAFRRDLYFRINTIPLSVPSLHERAEDVPRLARELLRRIGADVGIADAALEPGAEQVMQQYPWPGNVRELRNVLERALLLSGKRVIGAGDLLFDPAARATTAAETSQGPQGAAAMDADMTLEQMERAHIERALAAENGHVGKAAERLGIPRSSMYQKIQKHRIVVSRV